MLWCVLIVSVVVDISGATLPGLSNILPELPELPELPKLPNPVNVLFQNKCMEALGCFYTGPPFFHPLNRPLSLTPSSNLKTRYILFTPTNLKDEEILEPTEESVSNSSFDAKLPVKVLIHGFMANLDEDDIRFQMKDALLNKSDYNVIVVDWSQNNGPPYAQAVANTRAVGAQLAQLLKFLMDKTGVRAESVHIIGHSLGGQIAGYTGERTPNLGRITGLDPAGPYFQDADNSVRLDATDALFVDVIHTDGGENIVSGLGIGDPVGHMDFYPNGGRRQPGCTYTSSKDTPIGAVVNVTTDWVLTSCDHTRASHYFLESIDNSKCRFLATWCNNYDDFEKGDCLPQNSTLSEMGFYARRIPGVPIKSKFFLRTNESSPFCIEDSVYL